tara:strand:- start:2061 stop:2750 length:690 start_codon:yes stop_codon:yes gene_type:complete
MKRLLALMLAFAATTPAALTQPQTEPRLAGGPERICTDDEIRQALEGSYAGPPCSFTEMPAGRDALAQNPAPQQLDAVMPTQYRTAHVPPQPLGQPVTRQAFVSGHSESSSYTASQQHAAWRSESVVRPALQAPVQHRPAQQRQALHGSAQAIAGETVRLSDGFFTGGLVGGVERPFAPLYSYRGVILIAADGQVRTGHAGLAHRVLQVRALDNRPVPVPQPAVRRSYP